MAGLLAAPVMLKFAGALSPKPIAVEPARIQACDFYKEFGEAYRRAQLDRSFRALRDEPLVLNWEEIDKRFDSSGMKYPIS